MADEPKNTGLGAGEQGWLRRQRMAQDRMVNDKAERERVMEIRKRHRERVEAELAAKRARENGEEVVEAEEPARDEPPSDEIEMEQVETDSEEEGEQEEEAETEEVEGEEEEEEELKSAEDMTRGELFQELKERGHPQARKVSNDDLRDLLEQLRSEQDEE